MSPVIGVPPQPVTLLLRLEGLAIAAAAITGFAFTQASWWWFLLVLAPDLSFFGFALGPSRGAMIYNLAHTYVWAVLLIVLGLVTPLGWLLAAGLIWATHIGADRVLGYGLKYPEAPETTHLGLIGRAKKAAGNANAG